MLFKIVFSTLFYCVLSTTNFPNLFHAKNCIVLIGGENITFQNSFIQTEYENQEIFFSACKELAQAGCDKDSLACVKSNEEIINFIDKVEESLDFFSLKSKEGYLFDVKLVGRSVKHKPIYTKNKNYKLEINPDFKQHCTKILPNHRNLFFYDLYQRDIFIKTEDVKVSLNLCGTSPIGCPDDVSICTINKTTNQTIVWGKISHLFIEYNQANIVFNYKTQKKGGLHSAIILKCNWTTLEGPKSFKIINKNKLEVVIESYLGCSKTDLNCAFTDDIYLYNLTKLSRFNGWKINGFKGNVKLNICGPLKSQKTCYEQQSQVCLFDHHELNFGSISTPIKIENDVIKFSFKDGSQCPKNSTLNLQTIFELHCSFTEEGPKLIKENDCSIEIEWKTPEACPKLSRPLGSQSYEIKRSCSVEDGDKMYDLSMLSRNANNHIAKNGEVDFLINVCRPIINLNDTNCNDYMGMCLRNNAEPNIKKRFFNLGSVKSPSIKDGQLILQYASGSYDGNCFNDASAIIYFNCSDKDEQQPTFLNVERCVYTFQWNTKYACPNKINCLKKDNLDKTISFENVKSKSIQIKTDFKIYTIDICKDQLTTRDLTNNISEVKIHPNLQSDKNGIFLNYKLEKPCQRSKIDFNNIKIQLDCDPFLNNDHYEDTNISNCLLYLKLKHNEFCAFTPTTLKTITFEENDDSKTFRYDIVTENNPKIMDCIIQFNSEEIHLNNLEPLTIKSPNKQFNFANYTIGSNSTSVCYPHFICKENKPFITMNECPRTTSEKNGLKLTFNSTFGNQSEIFFYCKNENKEEPEVILETKNFVSFGYPIKELCFYENQNNGTSSLLIIGIVLCVVIICLCILMLYYRRFIGVLCKKDKSSIYVYCRDAEL